MDIYVSNLGHSISNEDLTKLFSKFGAVNSANIIIDKFTNRSRGFGFVTMPDDIEAEKAIKEMDGSFLDGKTIAVNKARPREERSSKSSYNNRW